VVNACLANLAAAWSQEIAAKTTIGDLSFLDPIIPPLVVRGHRCIPHWNRLVSTSWLICAGIGGGVLSDAHLCQGARNLYVCF
jgi:hypothetical protein